MNKNFRVLYKKTGQAPEIKIITDIFKVKKMIVSGILNLEKYENCIIVCNSKDKQQNKIPNIVLDFKHIAGDFFLIGYDPKIKDFRSLDIDEAIFYTDSLEIKSFQYKEYQKWIKKYSSQNNFNETNTIFKESQKNFTKKETTEITNTDTIDMILNIQALILKYIKRKQERRIKVWKHKNLKL